MFQDETILLAEDNEQHIVLIKHAFDQAHFSNPIQVVIDGAEAISYLQGAGMYTDRDRYPYPALMLLDLKMPRADGFQVLSWARKQAAHKSLPIVVLTNSEDIRHVNKAYELGANSFLVKPVNMLDLMNLVQAVQGFLGMQNKFQQHDHLTG